MAESSKAKRTKGKSISKKKVSVAAKSILKKKKTALKPKKKAAAKKRASVTQRKQPLRAVIVAPLKEQKADLPDVKELVEESKYYSAPVIQKFLNEKGFELPYGYNESRITVMVRDPHWIYTYWELPDWKIDELKALMGHDTFYRSKKILRIYDVTDINFTGMNANKSFDIGLSPDSRNWYINTGEPNRSFCIDLGFLTPEGKFYVAARSNVVSTPRDSMSEVIDEEWLTIDWERIYAMSGGFGIGRSSGEIKELLKKRLKEELSSGAVSSWGSDFMRQAEKSKDFWLVVNTELIVYGATEPDAKLSVQGLPIKLRPDGTFTMRFALPDGRQEIPVVAVNKDGDQKRQITPTVEKRTK